MDLADLLRGDELFLHASRRRWFGPRRLAVQGGAGLALAHDRMPRAVRIVCRLLFRWLGRDPVDLHLVPQGGGAALVLRRRCLRRTAELTDASGAVIATTRRWPWTPLFGLDLHDRHGKRAARIRGSLFSRTYRVMDADGAVLATLTGEDLGLRRGPQPGWRITRQPEAGSGSMLMPLAAALAVHLRWYDR